MDELIKGLRGLKNGALVNLISIALVLVAVLSVMGTVSGLRDPKMAMLALMALGSFLVLLLAAIALGIVGFILYFEATGHLKRYNPSLGIGRTGMSLQVLGIVLLFLSVFIIAGVALAHKPYAAVLAFPILALLSAVLLIVGAVLFGIMLMRLGDVPGVSSGFRTAGIIYLVGLVLSFLFEPVGSILGIVATVLIYKSAKDSLSSIG